MISFLNDGLQMYFQDITIHFRVHCLSSRHAMFVNGNLVIPKKKGQQDLPYTNLTSKLLWVWMTKCDTILCLIFSFLIESNAYNLHHQSLYEQTKYLSSFLITSEKCVHVTGSWDTYLLQTEASLIQHSHGATLLLHFFL